MLSPTLAVTVDGVDIGELGAWVRLRAQQHLNKASGWVLNAPIEAAFVDQFVPCTSAGRSGFILTDPAHKTTSTGYVDQVGKHNGAVAKISGVDDFGVLMQRQVFPEPNRSGPPFALSHWTHTGSPVDAIAELIDVNCGPNAHPDRRIPGLSIVKDPDLANPVGDIAFRCRFGRVSDVVAERASRTGVSVSVLCDGDGSYVVTVRQSRYLDAVVFDDTSAANRESNWVGTKGNVILAGGAGEGSARLFAQSSDGNPTGFARFEQFIDKRGVSDSAELEASATEQLSLGAESRSLDITLADAGSQVYGQDFQLGDHVWLVTDGQEGFVQVTGSDLTVDATGVKRTLTIGPALQAGTSPKSELSRRLSDLERGA